MTATIIAQLTDAHLQVAGSDESSKDALKRAVDATRAIRPEPAAVLVSGDLANDADPDAYALAGEILGLLPMPVVVIPGNHDDRALMRAQFGLAGKAADPIRHSARFGELRLIAIDTTVPGETHGAIGTDTIAWLDQELNADPATPTILAMHHSPVAIGIAGLDEIGIAASDRAALAGLLERHAQVQRIVAGHVHRGAVGRIGACPVFCSPGCHLQAFLDLEGDRLDLIDQPSAISLHLLVEGELVSHVEPV